MSCIAKGHRTLRTSNGYVDSGGEAVEVDGIFQLGEANKPS